MILNRKIWIVLVGAIMLLTAILGICFFVPRDCFGEEDIEIHLVIYRSSEEECTEITNEIDLNEMKTALRTMQCMRYREQFAPYWLGDVQYEITGLCGSEPFHLVLGNAEINYLYASSDRGGYPICEQERWIRVLNELNPLL